MTNDLFYRNIAFILIVVTVLGIKLARTNIRLFPPWITVIRYVNDNYTVKCEGNGTKLWKYSNGQILNDRPGSPIFTIEKDSENVLYLKFVKIQKEYKGVYTCSIDRKYSKRFELVVIQPVTFTSNVKTEILVNNIGDELNLECDVEGEPQPIISWFLNDKLLSDNLLAENAAFSIKEVSPSHAGIYTCRAFQKIEQTRDVEIKYDVKVRHKPVPVTIFNKDKDSKNSRSVVCGFRNEYKNLTCTVLAYPVAYFVWYRHNDPIDAKIHRVKVYNFDNKSILEVLINDRSVLGVYNCEAANPLGIFIQNIELTEIERPQTPSKILIYEKTHSTAVISVFLEPYPSYNFTYKLDFTEYTYCKYDEKWKRATTTNCSNERIEFTNKTRCKIENLKSSTKYAIRATLLNEGGYGNFSKEILFRTKAESSRTVSNVLMKFKYRLLIVCFLFVYYTSFEKNIL